MVRLWPVFALALVTATQAYAVPVEGLYESVVPLSENTPAAIQNAQRAALGDVLVKVTGAAGAATDPDTADLRRNATNFFRSYSEGTRDGENVITVQFSPGSLNQALNQLGLPVWGRERPLTLLWLAVAPFDGRNAGQPGGPAPGPVRWISSESEAAQVRVLQTVSERRGVAILRPLLDLTERRLVSADDLRLGRLDGLRLASRRYGADVLLAAVADEIGSGIWQARWYLVIENQLDAWESRGVNLDMLVEEAVSRAVDGIVDRYVQPLVTQPDERFRLTIEDVLSLNDYVRLSKYIRELERVREVAFSELTPDRVQVDLLVRGGVTAFDQAVLLGNMLQRVPGPANTYRLIPR